MKTLDEFNADKMREYELWKAPHPAKNGIVCPKCGNELFDSDPYIILGSDPPQKEVYCDCGFRGYRIA